MGFLEKLNTQITFNRHTVDSVMKTDPKVALILEGCTPVSFDIFSDERRMHPNKIFQTFANITEIVNAQIFKKKKLEVSKLSTVTMLEFCIKIICYKHKSIYISQNFMIN